MILDCTSLDLPYQEQQAVQTVIIQQKVQLLSEDQIIAKNIAVPYLCQRIPSFEDLPEEEKQRLVDEQIQRIKGQINGGTHD